MNKRGAWKSIRTAIRQSPLLVALLLVVMLGVIVASLIPPQILKTIIDSSLVPGQPAGLLRLAAVYLGVLALAAVFDFLKEAILTVIGQRITCAIRADMMLKLEKIQARYFSANSTGAVLSRFTNDVDAINALFTGGVVGLAVDLLKVVGIVLSMWLFSPTLGLLTVVVLPLIYGITRAFQKRMLKAQGTSRVLVGQINNHIAESFNNAQMIKSCSKEDYMEQLYAASLAGHFRAMGKINFYDSVFSPLIQILRAAAVAVIVVLSASRLNLHGLTLGMVAAAIELITNLFGPIENLGMELQNIQLAISGMNRVNEFLGEAEDAAKPLPLAAREIVPDPASVRLTFEHVGFQYEAGQVILDDICLDLKPRQHIAFVGRTGVGKTTLFKLILGLMPPTQGSIRINGADVSQIPNSEKRRLFGYVDQKFRLVKGTVADQVTLLDPAVSREEVERALELVGLSDDVAALAKGLDTPVDDRTAFSQGQKQLLAIARAIVGNPAILLLDEITANLDAITEEHVAAALRKAASRHTILSISHRLSTILSSDLVVILDNGRVRSAGSPEYLLANDEWYRSHLALEKLTWN